jgi:hypothetical protein
MICKTCNFDEILENFTKFLIGKKMMEWFIFKCVNVCNVTSAYVCNIQILQPINFPHLPMRVVRIFFMSQITLLHSPHSMKHLQI